MSSTDLSLEAVRDFMLIKGGKVTNHDLVKHFKNVLTHPDTRVQARNEFKEIVNTVATIVRSDEGEKYLVLKKKYRTPSIQSQDHYVSPVPTPDLNPSSSMSSLFSLGDKRSMAHSTSQDSLDSATSATSPTRQPPPYRPPPPPVSATTPPLASPPTPVSDAPPVPPRKKSTGSNKENSPEAQGRPTTIGAEAEVDESDPENKISVKECMQKFQRMASESALQKAHLPASKKRFDKGGSDKDEDTHSFVSLDPKAREWMVKSAQSDYQALHKLASENPKLTRFKTALHWAAKHGNVEVIKLIAGAHKMDVNTRTNGGYTACHIAMQYGHEDVFNLLKDVYGANPALRDYSGRKPHQYLTNKDTSVSADTFRKIKARKKHAEKDSGFLRIGSLNVRVKKTTEAFSHFLGVGTIDKLHKSWGSADNLPQGDSRKMPPPKHAPIKKRKSKRAMDFAPPSRPESVISVKSLGGGGGGNGGADSDSDTAAGFGTNWQATV